MTDDADHVEALPEELDGGQGVVTDVVRRDGIGIAGGAADAAVVEAERGVAGAGEGVRDDREGFMFEHLLVPVLLAAARHHDEGEGLAGIAFRQRQRAAQDDIAVVESHLLLCVGERPDRGLRPVQLPQALREGEGQGSAHLREGAHDLAVLELPLVGGGDRRDLDAHLALFGPGELDGNPLGALVGDVHRGILFFKVENDTEFHPLDLDVAGPGAGLRKSHGEGGKQQDRCRKDFFHRLNRRFGLIELVKVQIPFWTSNTYPRIMLFL